MEKLQKISELKCIQGEMPLIDLFAFYAMGVLLCYFLTIPKWTHKARVWLIMNMALSLFMELCMFGVLSGQVILTPVSQVTFLYG